MTGQDFDDVIRELKNERGRSVDKKETVEVVRSKKNCREKDTKEKNKNEKKKKSKKMKTSTAEANDKLQTQSHQNDKEG